MVNCMTFPKTVDEFMEEYKIVDSKQIYTNGTELVPIFRMKQWFEHLSEDVQSVIRCKDCDSAERSGVMIYCLMHGRYMRDNDFCSYGKREDSEQNA